jgi:hypothetical protein
MEAEKRDFFKERKAFQVVNQYIKSQKSLDFLGLFSWLSAKVWKV